MPHRHQDTGHERRSVVRVVPDRERLARWYRGSPLGARPSRASAPSAPAPASLASPPRAPSATTVLVGSAAHSFDASTMREAVSIAVPEGASTFASWCSSMISAVSNHGAASAAKWIINTAPIAKFAATTAFACECANSSASSSKSSSVKPVVPTTAWTPCAATPAKVLARRAHHGEVDADLGVRLGQRVGTLADHHVRTGHGLPRVMRVHRGHELAVRSFEHRLTHRGAHATTRAEHSDLDHPRRLNRGRSVVTRTRRGRRGRRRRGLGPRCRSPGRSRASRLPS